MAEVDLGLLASEAKKHLAPSETAWDALLAAAPTSADLSMADKELGPSDFDLDEAFRAELPGRRVVSPPLKPAAVLVPILKTDGLPVVFTERAGHLPAHAGQIAFPGGKYEPADIGPLNTALREAHEEIGLASALVEPIGRLPAYRTGTGYEITPVLGLVDPQFVPQPDTSEVADVFEVPLSFLMDARHHQIHKRATEGRDRRFYAMPYGERFIWGATAGILRTLYERLFQR